MDENSIKNKNGKIYAIEKTNCIVLKKQDLKNSFTFQKKKDKFDK